MKNNKLIFDDFNALQLNQIELKCIVGGLPIIPPIQGPGDTEHPPPPPPPPPTPPFGDINPDFE